MKNIGSNILVILIFGILSNLLLRNLLKDFWGNNTLEEKITCAHNIASQINTLAIGSSRFLFQFDPILFDSINIGQTLTYNMGSRGANPVENFALLKNVINNYNLKYVILEYDTYRGTDYAWINSIKCSYYWNWPLFYSIIKYYPYTTKEFSSHLKLYIKSLLFLGEGKDIVASFLLSNKKRISSLFQSKSLDKAINHLLVEDKAICENRGYIPRDNFLPSWTEEQRKKWINSHTKTYQGPKHTDPLTEDIYEQIAALCHLHKVELWLIFNPHDLSVDNSKLNNKIYLGDQVSFPEYYEAERWYDRYHMNDKGGKAYTRRIAQLMQLKNK